MKKATTLVGNLLDLLCIYRRMTSEQKGELAQLKVQIRAVEKGYVASRPTVSCRYDLIIDINGKLVRAQVKYADGKMAHSTGSVYVSLRRFTNDNKYNRKPIEERVYTADEIDILLVYVPRADSVLLFEPSVFAGRKALAVRVEPPKNGQKKGLLMAENFVW